TGADETNERHPIRKALANPEQELWLRVVDVLLLEHVVAVPRALCFVEHDQLLIRNAICRSEACDELVQVANGNGAMQGVLKNLHQRAVTGKERRARLGFGAFIDDAESDKRLTCARDTRQEDEAPKT